MNEFTTHVVSERQATEKKHERGFRPRDEPQNAEGGGERVGRGKLTQRRVARQLAVQRNTSYRLRVLGATTAALKIDPHPEHAATKYFRWSEKTRMGIDERESCTRWYAETCMTCTCYVCYQHRASGVDGILPARHTVILRRLERQENGQTDKPIEHTHIPTSCPR